MGTSLSRTLSKSEVDAFGAELDDLRARTLAKVGEEDARYIRRIRAAVRYSEAAGRGLLFLSFLPPAWVAGTGLLSLSKILENMELGHNVMHGQYDWMNDPSFQSSTYEWDNVCTADAWRRYHNYIHHTYTNVLDRDRDIGYSLLRLFPEQRWKPRYILQPFKAMALATMFQWGVAFHGLEADQVVRDRKQASQLWADFKPIARKIGRKVFKDYVFFPALAGPMFLHVMAGNLVANLVRNLWAFGIIFCGHFTEDAETFPESVLDGETRGEWYLRQIRGSSNLRGGRLFHIMSGNLSHQIEHHLFPDIPAHRYAEMAVEVEAICQRYGIHYNTGSFWKQFATVARRIVVHSLPTRPEPALPAQPHAA